MRHTYDVIVIGGHIVGLSLSLACAKMGLQVLVIDAKSLDQSLSVWDQQSPFDLRVFAINRASEDLWQSLQVWSGIESRRCFPYTHLEVCDANSTAQLSLSAAERLQPNLGIIVEQQVCFQALLSQARQEPLIVIQSSVVVQSIKVDELEATVTLVGDVTFRAPLVVGSDGANSWVRTHVQIPLIRKDYGQQALVATVRPQICPKGMAYQCFDKTGPLALLPMNDVFSIVWSMTPEEANRRVSLPIKEFDKELTLQSQHRFGQLTLESERFLFPLTMQQAKKYVLPRMALAGDAAHTFHPLAGQGLNTGLRDVRMLVRVLQKALDKGWDRGSLFVLNQYQRECIGHNFALTTLMKALSWGFSTSLQPVKLLRQFGLNQMASQPFIKRWLIAEALGLEDINNGQ